MSNQLRQVKLRSHWLVGIEESNVRLGRSPTVRNVAIVDVQRGAKTLDQAMTLALRRYAKANKTNVIALKVVSLVWKRGTEVKTFIDVYGDLKTLRETQPLQQVARVIYDSSQVDKAFSVQAPPKFTEFTCGNMTLKVRSE